MDRGEHALPNTLRGALALLSLQAASLVLLAGLTTFVMLRGNLATALLPFAVFALVLAAGLGALAWQLALRRGWARGPAVTLQILLVPLGGYLLRLGLVWVGLPLLVVAVGCIVLLIAPASRAALGIR